MEYQRIFKDGINLYLGKIGGIAITFINLMLLTRVLTTEEMGKYSLFLMVVNLALVFALNWSLPSLVRFGREEYIQYGKSNQTFWATFYIYITGSVIALFLLVIFQKQIADYIGIDKGWILLLICMFILNGGISLIIKIQQSMDKMKKSAYVAFLQKLFFMAVLLFVFFNDFDTKLGLILIFINLSFLISLLINIPGINFKGLAPHALNKKYLQKVWTYSWPQLIGFSGLYVINYIDLYVIRRFLTLEDVGLYSVAYNGFANIIVMIMVINTLFMPLIVEYRAQGKFHLIRSYAKKMPLCALCWIGLVAIGIMLSKYFIPLVFSAKYMDSIPSFNILLITTAFYFISIYLLPIVNAFDLILYSQIFNIIKSLVNIGADFIFIPAYGIIGAAYGTMAAYGVGVLLTITLVYLKKRSIFGAVST